MPRIIFMGTPEFSVPALEKLHETFGVEAVVTVPDKKQGRGQKTAVSPVKAAAERLSIPVLQPDSLKDENFIAELKKYDADIFCVIAFRILPPEVFGIPKMGSFNIHASLLPRYRGAAPINWAIINGEKETGLTSFILQQTVDTGKMLLQKKLPVTPGMTAGELHDSLMPLAADLAVETCALLASGSYDAKPQDDKAASPAPKIFRDTCRISWNKGETVVRNFIHGLAPYPGAWTVMDGHSLKILRCDISDRSLPPGTFSIDKRHFLVGTGGKALSLSELQQEGKRQMNIRDFLAGYRGEASGKLD